MKLLKWSMKQKALETMRWPKRDEKAGSSRQRDTTQSTCFCWEDIRPHMWYCSHKVAARGGKGRARAGRHLLRKSYFARLSFICGDTR